MTGENWHSRTVEETVHFWCTNLRDGLSSGEVKERLNRFGYNELVEKSRTPWWKRFLAQFRDFMVLVLLAATLISAFLGEYVDALTILAIVLINAILGFIQENRAEQSMQALKQLAAPTARVLRNGNIQHVPARELVPGDVVILEAGDKIGADGRVAGVHNMEVDEAALTGESLPVRKVADKNFNEDVALADRKNMVYAGTIVTRGRGTAVVCSTGMDSEVGHIAGMIQSTGEDDTPLERRLEHLGRWLVWGCLVICLIVVVTGVLKGESIFLMCMAGISLAVAAIPEGLPAIVTVSLALGVQRMIKRNVIIRKLPAVETLGCTTVICSDKTGTITQNAMTVRKIFSGGKHYEVTGSGYEIKGQFLLDGREVDINSDKALKECLIISALCNNSVLKRNNVGITGIWRNRNGNGWSVEGDPTEGALTVVAAKAGIWRIEVEKSRKRLAETPFEPERRRMSVVYNDDKGANFLYVKGAADTILELCRYYNYGSGEVPLTPDIVNSILAVNEQMASQALRVLAVAYRQLPGNGYESCGEEVEKELVFAGLVGMIDPPREEAKQATALCQQAGIKTVMITGDHPNTAIAIAKELRIYKEDTNRALTGKELEQMSDGELVKIVNDVTVYARVSPAHKLRIVKALKKRGHIVAMTGDGVNDAPAVREADIGISMGLSGTDVTKEASSMVLVDDNFAAIVAAIEEGRGIYDNIRKFIRYLLSCNIGEVLTMFVAALAGLPLPLLPVQILWVNLVTDGLPAMALGVDPNDRNIMLRPPRNPRESVFSRGLSRKIISRGIQIGFSTLLVFAMVYYMNGNLELARTMAFSTLVFCQLFHVFDCCSEVYTIFEIGILRNKYLLLSVGCSILMHIAVIYLPMFSRIFGTVPMSLYDWIIVLVVSGWTFIFGGLKHILWRRWSVRGALGRV